MPLLLESVNPDKPHWVGLHLIGGPKSPRDAVGATVYLTAGGIRQRVGLGDSTTIAKIGIRWPNGFVENVSLPGPRSSVQ